MKENFENNPGSHKETLVKELKDKMLVVSKRGNILETYDKISEFGEKLLEKYPDARSYLLFHLLIGSTPPYDLSLFDFPGDDSVEKFIKEKL